MDENKENVIPEEKAKAARASHIKRNVTISVVLVCICAAVYLNWSYNNKKGADSALDASLVSAKNGEETVATSGEDDYISEYFAQARLTRQQSRDEALALLQTAAASSASQDTIDGVMNAISAMATYSMQETQIENLLLAKDFAECVVFMSSDGITIAVPTTADGLTADQVAKITDAVITETTYNATQIHIIPVKKPAAEPAPAPDAPAETKAADAGNMGTQGGYLDGDEYIFE